MPTTTPSPTAPTSTIARIAASPHATPFARLTIKSLLSTVARWRNGRQSLHHPLSLWPPPQPPGTRQPAPSSFCPTRQNQNWGTSTQPCVHPLPESAMPKARDCRCRPTRLCPPLSLLLLSRGTGREQVLNRPFSHQQF